VNLRCTRSFGFALAGSGFVVETFFDRFTPRTPASRMSRPVWSRPTIQP
jgi:hypothetical protein